MSELRALAKFISHLQWEEVPENVRKKAKMVLADSVGVGIGARFNQQNIGIIKEFTSLDSGHHVSVWGQGIKTSLFNAVFLNALQGHTLELDDVHTGSKTHIGTVVVPAVWGGAEHEGKGGEELLLALLCGYETTARIGMALGVLAHRNLGWHATSTAGVIGAAAAVAKLLGLSEDQIVYAMGMAGQVAGGTWAFLGDGATCKILNPAMAACNGAKCAYLAKAGMTGPEHVMTSADGGMLSAMSGAYEESMVSRGLGTTWEILMMDNKPYPACRSTHCTIDAALYLRSRYSVDPEDVDHIDVYTYEVGYKQCGQKEASIRPRIPVHAKFSSPFTVAVAMICGEVGLKHFEQEFIDRVEVQDFLKRVNIFPEDCFTEQYPGHWGCRVEIYKKDGEVLKATVADACGSVDNPLTEEQLDIKLRNVLRDAKLDDGQVTQMLDILDHIDRFETVPFLG